MMIANILYVNCSIAILLKTDEMKNGTYLVMDNLPHLKKTLFNTIIIIGLAVLRIKTNLVLFSYLKRTHLPYFYRLKLIITCKLI